MDIYEFVDNRHFDIKNDMRKQLEFFEYNWYLFERFVGSAKGTYFHFFKDDNSTIEFVTFVKACIALKMEITLVKIPGVESYDFGDIGLNMWEDDVEETFERIMSIPKRVAKSTKISFFEIERVAGVRHGWIGNTLRYCNSRLKTVLTMLAVFGWTIELEDVKTSLKPRIFEREVLYGNQR